MVSRTSIHLSIALAMLSGPLAAAPPAYEGRTWRLVFSDEFDGASLDLSKWSYHYPWGRTHNHEAYSREQNVSLVGGKLVLKALEQSYGGKPFTTGVVNTNGKFHVTYGWLEARIQMPSSVGSWPAFWTLQDGWPPEIDIMEFPLSDVSQAHNEKYRYWWNYHWGTVSDHRSAGSEEWLGADLTAGFHEYAVEWQPDILRFAFDGEERGRVTDRAAIGQSARHYMILNYAVGGWPGYPPSWPAGGDTYEIEWVRVWQLEEPADLIDLGNIVGNGDGGATTVAPSVGIDPGTGAFSDDLGLDSVAPSGAPFQPVPGSLVDGVFLIPQDRVAINTRGTTFAFPPGDASGSTWDLISNVVEADGPPGVLRLGPKGPFLRGIGLHSSAGVTFDLDGIRARHGVRRTQFFSSFAGEGSHQAGGTVRSHVILADAQGRVLHSVSTGPAADDGRRIEVEIPRNVRYLTLATGAAGDGNGQDHGVFANAFLTPCGVGDPTLCGSLPPDEALVFSGSTWRYLDTGAAPAGDWTAADFPDGGWSVGAAQLGFGDGDESTTIGYGGDPDRKRVTTHFRRLFQVSDSPGVSSLSLRLLADDGAIVWLNDTEVVRTNLPAGPVGPDTLASAGVDGVAERTWTVAEVDPCLLADGTNVLAVEVHQASRTSSDLGFDLALVADRGAAGRPPCGLQFLRGDSNGDGTIDIADAIHALGYLFVAGAPPPCFDAADSNDDGALDIGDPIFVLGFLYLGGAPFPAPSSSCGADPTDDSLGCAAYAPCS